MKMKTIDNTKFFYRLLKGLRLDNTSIFSIFIFL